MPKTIGIKTICMIDTNMLPADTGSHLLASNNVNAGVNIGASNVDTAVTETDSAVFPFARKVITFDAVPPGPLPTKMTPTATSGGSSNTVAKPKASNGMIVNCASTPMKTLLGTLKTDLKSFNVSVKPMPNMITPSKRDTCGAIQENPPGNKKLKMANKITQIANVFPAKLLTLSNVFTLLPSSSLFIYYILII